MNIHHAGLNSAAAGRQQINTPLVSVIIPDYNQAHFLRDAVQSVLDQTFSNYEIIIIDDGSTDNSPEVIAEFGDQVHCIRQSNQGLSAARNTGIAASQGQLIGLLDSDDAWLPDYLMTMVSTLKANPQAGAVYSGWQYMDSLGRVLPQLSKKIVAPEAFLSTLTFGNFLVPSGVLVRRECFDKVGFFDTNLRAVEDRDMWLRISSVYPMVGVPQVLVCYRIHGENMTKDLVRMEVARRAVIEKHLGKEDGDSTAWPPLKKQAYAGFYLRTALDHFQVGETHSGRQYLCQAFSIYPALIEQVDTYYELACTDQPRGARGTPETVDLNRSSQSLFDHLDAVLACGEIPQEVETKKDIVYGYANLAMGRLAYNSHDMKRARAHLKRAVSMHYGLAIQTSAVPLLMRAIVGRRATQMLKQLMPLRRNRE